MEEVLFVDKHRLALVQRVKNIEPILDGLLSYKVINREHYEEILSLHGPQEKMRTLLRGPLRVCGPGGKEKFYKLLRKHESDLLDDLADESEKYKKNKKDMEVESMGAQKILLETLNDLSSDELNQFKSLIELEESFPRILRGRLKVANTDEIVDLMVKTFSGKCVNMNNTVLKKMNRTDLVQRLSDISSGTKEEPLPSLIQSVETMASVIELLLETLKDLRDQDLESFQRVLSQIQSDNGYPHISLSWHMMRDRQDMVFYLVQNHSEHRLLEMTTKAFEKMNRTDLVQRLSQSSSGPKKKHSEAQRPAVIQKVATMAAVKHLLLETLNDLRNEDLEKFKQYLDLIVTMKKQIHMSWELSSSPGRAKTVERMMQIFGQQCIEITMEVLKDINRTDLRQRLTNPSSELKEMYSVDEHRPAQSEGVQIAAEKEILLKTLKDLSDHELHKCQCLLPFTFFQKSISYSFHGYPYWTESALQLVDQMVETCGPQSVEVTREVLMDLDRTDLVERLSETILRLKEEPLPSLIQSVEMMASVIELLLETLKDLSDQDLQSFQRVLSQIQSDKGYPDISPRWHMMRDRQDMVFYMVQDHSQHRLLEMTTEAFEKMNRTDLVQRLSQSSSGPKKKHSEAQRPAVIQKVATMAAVKHLLLETLNDLRNEDLEKFKQTLDLIVSKKKLRYVSWIWSPSTGRARTVEQMMGIFGQQCVEITMEVLKDINRTDLRQRFTNLELKEMYSVDEHRPAQSERALIAAEKEILLKTLKDMSGDELYRFQWYLQFTYFQKSISYSFHENPNQTGSALQLVDQMVETCGPQSVEVTREVLMDMKTSDVVERLSETILRLKGPTDPSLGSAALPAHNAEPEPACLPTEGEERLPSLIQSVETMASVIELLLETLKDLSDQDLQSFQMVLSQIQSGKGYPDISPRWHVMRDRQDMVFYLVQDHSQHRLLEMTTETFEKMNRTDLVQRLSQSSSGPKKKHSEAQRPAVIQKVATMAAVKHLLLETLYDLRNEDLEKFKQTLDLIVSKKKPRYFSLILSSSTSRAQIVEEIIQIFGQQCVEITMEVLKDINRTDLRQRLRKPSSELKEMYSVDEHRPAQSEGAPIAAEKEILLKTLKDLSDHERYRFKCLLQFTYFQKSISYSFHGYSYRTASALQLVDQMVETCGPQSVEVTREVLMDLDRTDLVERLSETILRLKALEVDPNKDIVCKLCGAWFETRKGLSSHAHRAHLRPFGVEYSPIDLPHHQATSSLLSPPAKRLKSSSMSFYRLSSGEFKALPHSEPPKEIGCEFCGEYFENRKGLRSHARSHLRQMGITKWSVNSSPIDTLREIITRRGLPCALPLKPLKTPPPSSPGPPRSPLPTSSSPSSSSPSSSLLSLFPLAFASPLQSKFCSTPGSDKVFPLNLEEPLPSVIQSVETMASVIELLLETLKDLSHQDLESFKRVLSQILSDKGYPDISPRWHMMRDRQDMVFYLVQDHSEHRLLEMTTEAFERMNRTDLVQRLSQSSSGPKKKHSEAQQPAVIQKVATMAAVKHLLLETLNDLRNEDLEKFKQTLDLIVSKKKQRYFSWIWSPSAGRDQTVEQMMEIFGQQCVELTMEVLKDINRTDLRQRFTNLELKEMYSVDEHRPAQSEGAPIAAEKEILLKTLKDMSDHERYRFKCLLQFTYFQKSISYSFHGYPYWTASALQLVDQMVETCGPQSVEVTREVLMDLNRTDLVERLSETILRLKEEPLPSVIQSVETMASVIELLLETLKDLSDQDLPSFKRVLSQILSDKGNPDISPRWLMMRDRQDMVFYLVRDHSQHRLLEMTTEAFERMNRTDLVQRLSQSSSGPKKKHSEAQRPAVIQKVATMAAVKNLLLETLNDLRNEDLEKFMQTLDLIVSKKKLRYFSWILRSSPGRAQTVEQMIQIYGQQCVEITMEVLKDINRTDLRQRLTKPSSELKEMYSVDEHRPAQSEGAPIAAEKEILLKTLKDMSDHELYRFQWYLPFTYFQKSISSSFHGYPYQTGSALQLVDQMVETCGPQSVEVTREVLMDLDRTDLVERLSETILRLKDKHPSKPPKEEVTVASLEKKLLETLEDLSDGELEKFKRGLQIISNQRLETAGRVEIVDLMVEIYGQQSMELTMEILEKMKEDDYGLEQKLSNITLGSKGPSRSLELEGSEKMMKDSSGWTKLEPEVNSTDEDEASTYSLKSEAGNFECSVSGLRWVCQEKVSFKYQFCSSEEPMKRMEMMKYMPAGPLIDITGISGKLFEVYLPHWICIDDIPKILQKFAVLHIDDCGDVVEKVSVVTSSHVKLSEPVFSPRAVLMKMGFPVKIHCNVLIYSKLNTSCILLHVYLTPLDPALKETMDKKKKHFKLIQKPRPNECLTLHQDFNLKADITTAQIGPKQGCAGQKPRPDEGLTLHEGFNLTAGITAEICPEKITLRYESQEPNFYEVYIENPDSNLHLTLSQLNKGKRKKTLWSCVIRKGKRKPQWEPVWSCEIRKVDLRNSGDSDVKETGGQPSITGPWDMEATGGPSSENELRDTVGPSAGETAQYTMVDVEATGGPSSENELRDTVGPSAGETAQYTMVDVEATGGPSSENELRDTVGSSAGETAQYTMVDVEATGGPSSENELRDTVGPSAGETAQYTMVDGEHFVDKHRIELTKRVNCVADILDRLLEEKVITPSIYSEILEIRTTQQKMRELFRGPLNAAGPRGKEVFYRILEKEEKYLIDELKGNK
ncbi:uncharacterized protein LOC117500508 [Trematomus bernacchii]|uniref:uncharacterized protein LOC117500508 n=1 Tax=Trematomus bernacchii TaxID=40690 RepID=UPI00146D00D2|nr:uncharacterized protein LOC117500508 [Trematomus bernacchii]